MTRKPGARRLSRLWRRFSRILQPLPRRFVVIPGAMKAGTSSLFEAIAAHPRVARSRPKEPNYFCSDHFARSSFRFNLRQYSLLFDYNPDRHSHCIEASTSYTKTPDFPNCGLRIASAASIHKLDVKIVYAVRDPASAFESYCRHAMRASWGDDFRPPRKATDDLPQHPLNILRYAYQLDHYRELFEAGCVLVTRLEDLSCDGSALTRVFDFLGLDHGDIVFPESNRGEQQIRRTKLAVDIDDILNYRLSPALRRQLREVLRVDLRRLESEYKVPTADWKIWRDDSD